MNKTTSIYEILMEWHKTSKRAKMAELDQEIVDKFLATVFYGKMQYRPDYKRVEKAINHYRKTLDLLSETYKLILDGLKECPEEFPEIKEENNNGSK